MRTGYQIKMAIQSYEICSVVHMPKKKQKNFQPLKFKLLALLDFSNNTELNGSNSDNKNSQLAGFMTLRKIYSLFYSHSFCNDFLRTKSILGQCVSNDGGMVVWIDHAALPIILCYSFRSLLLHFC